MALKQCRKLGSLYPKVGKLSFGARADPERAPSLPIIPHDSLAVPQMRLCPLDF